MQPTEGELALYEIGPQNIDEVIAEAEEYEIDGSFKSDGVIFEEKDSNDDAPENNEGDIPERTLKQVSFDERPEDLRQTIKEVLTETSKEFKRTEIKLPIETIYDLFPLMNKKYTVIEPGNLSIRDAEKDIVEIKGVKIRTSKRPVRESEYDFLVVSDPKKGLFFVKERDTESAGLYNGTELPGVAKLKEHITKFSPDGWGKSFIYIDEGRLKIRLQRVPAKNKK